MPKIKLHTNRDEIDHLNRLEQYARRVKYIYDQAIKEFQTIAEGLSIDPTKTFSFSQFPQTNKRVSNLIKKIVGDVATTVKFGMLQEWNAANNRNDNLVDSLFHFKTNKQGKTFTRYKQRNIEALNAFQERKEKGLGLSDRIWKNTEQYRKEIEVALDLGIGKGKSAAALARDVKMNLVNSEKMLKEFTNKHGVKSLRQVAEIANPGQGVYKSATKNAERLTRTETNMAYRTSDYTRWQQMDFVVGFEVKRSNRGSTCPVCEALKGKYPKGFKFVGWHPHCLCYMIPIMMSDDELDKLEDAILNDEPVNFKSKNEVTDVPANFRNWIRDNKDRIDRAKSQPFFIRDNQKAVKNILETKKEKAVKTKAEPIKPKEKVTKSIQPDKIKTIKEFEYLTAEEYNQLKETPITAAERKKLYFGEGYIATPNSFDINNHLRGQPLRDKAAITENDLGVIDLLKNVIARDASPKDIKVIRRVNGQDLSNITSIKNTHLKAGVPILDYSATAKSLQSRKGTSFTEKGFMSVSLQKDKNFFTNRDVVLEIEVPKGTNWMVTSNNLESEAILAPDSKFEILSINAAASNDGLVIRLRMID